MLLRTVYTWISFTLNMSHMIETHTILRLLHLSHNLHLYWIFIIHALVYEFDFLTYFICMNPIKPGFFIFYFCLIYFGQLRHSERTTRQIVFLYYNNTFLNINSHKNYLCQLFLICTILYWNSSHLCRLLCRRLSIFIGWPCALCHNS